MTTMKGLLKGLRYISQIFDSKKEEEMQIGHPTDVKHVAHIGWDGPSANTPNWMNEVNGTSPVPSNGEAKDNPSTKSSIKDSPLSGAPLDSPTPRNSSKTKQSRRNHSSTASVGSPTRDLLGTNQPRRHKNSGGLDSPTRESTNRARRLQNSNLGSESPSEGPPRVTKESRQKKSKGSLGGRPKDHCASKVMTL
ncbi:CRIB domain-containing protein RIC6-like [Actinidia eriantha]|uniref:CRIB domain-containing protein RIC6-like n=1 Tax=Actinidia eriantha TaxID=165200 RepID=UPI00258BE4EE|nr:CRIB domain-containing protein RIC6-like [Actinidia eriantha]